MEVYVVQAVRNGDFSKDSYLVGVFKTKESAINVAEKEFKQRGSVSKYCCYVYEVKLDEYDERYNIYKTQVFEIGVPFK